MMQVDMRLTAERQRSPKTKDTSGKETTMLCSGVIDHLGDLFQEIRDVG